MNILIKKRKKEKKLKHNLGSLNYEIAYASVSSLTRIIESASVYNEPAMTIVLVASTHQVTVFIQCYK